MKNEKSCPAEEGTRMPRHSRVGTLERKESLPSPWDNRPTTLARPAALENIENHESRKSSKLRLAIRTTLARPTRDVQAAAAEGRHQTPQGRARLEHHRARLERRATKWFQGGEDIADAAPARCTPKPHASGAPRREEPEKKEKIFHNFQEFQKIVGKWQFEREGRDKGGRLKLRRPYREAECL